MGGVCWGGGVIGGTDWCRDGGGGRIGRGGCVGGRSGGFKGQVCAIRGSGVWGGGASWRQLALPGGRQLRGVFSGVWESSGGPGEHQSKVSGSFESLILLVYIFGAHLGGPTPPNSSGLSTLPCLVPHWVSNASPKRCCILTCMRTHSYMLDKAARKGPDTPFRRQTSSNTLLSTRSNALLKSTNTQYKQRF